MVKRKTERSIFDHSHYSWNSFVLYEIEFGLTAQQDFTTLVGDILRDLIDIILQTSSNHWFPTAVVFLENKSLRASNLNSRAFRSSIFCSIFDLFNSRSRLFIIIHWNAMVPHRHFWLKKGTVQLINKVHISGILPCKKT